MAGLRYLAAFKKRYFLSFQDKDLENEFNNEHNRSGLRSMRISVVLAIILYLLFGALDIYFLPSVAGKILTIRLFVTFYFLLILLTTSYRFLLKYFQSILISVVTVAGGGILLMILIADTELSNNYYAGLLLVIIWAHSYLGMRFINAAISTWLIIIVYEIIANFFTRTPGILIISNSFFLISANILGMFASYELEFYKRSSFMQKLKLEIEYKHKAKELEDAREIQLSMLPQKAPDYPGIEFEMFILTAAEIGGDYYDFSQSEKGILKFTIGDATGHGARAGAMVTATKILFCDYVQDLSLPDFLSKASASIKQMGLPNLYMALAVGEIRPNRLLISGAGIPPALLFRAANCRLETIHLKGLPLGIQSDNFKYQLSEYPLFPGDTLLFMTDGFPELFNASGQMLGIEMIRKTFLENADKCAPEIKSALFELKNSWLKDIAPQDDITFIIIKIKKS